MEDSAKGEQDLRRRGVVSRRQLLQRGGQALAVGSLGALLAACTDNGNGGQAASPAGGASPGTATGALGQGFPGGEALFVTFFSTLNYFDGHKQGFQDGMTAVGGGDYQTVGPTDADPAAEIEEMERAIAQGVPFAVVAFEDELFAPVIDRALEAGIPVVTTDGGSPTSKASHVGTGNLQAGITVGNRLIEEIGGSGTVLLTRQATENPAFIQREEGFKQAIAATGGDVEIATTINDFDNAERAATAVGQALQAHGDISAIFTISAGAGLGTVQAVRDAGRQDLKVGVFSNDPAVYETLTEPDTPLAFVAAQETYKMGFFSALMLAVAAAEVVNPDYDYRQLGVAFPLPTSIDTGLAIVDQGNVDAFLA